MPRPGKNEKKKDFIKRCVPIVIEDGTAKDSDQAVAICNSLWEKKKMTDTEIKSEAILEGAKILEKATEEKSNGKDKHGIIYYVPYGAISFEDVDEYMKSQIKSDRVGELTRIFQDLVWNIMASEDIDDKTAAMNALTKEFNDRVMDAMSLSDAGIVGGVLQFFKDKLPKKKEKINYRNLMIWKEGDRYRWVSIYTNKYRDEDAPPEILAEAAHEQFVKDVEAGVHPYPELWHWHTPGTRWGTSDLLHFDKDTGFMVASGWVDAGHEKEAEAVMALDDIKTSHGMPAEFIKREDKDNTVITGYASREISDLPARYAANQLTGFNIIKEVEEKMIPEEKKAYFRQVGMTDEAISALEADMEGKAKQAEGLEFKEADEPVVEPTETPKVEEPEVDATPAYATREEVAEAIVETVKPIAEAVTAIAGSISELKESDETKIAKAAADIPAASIGAIIAKQWSAIGADATKVDGRTKESKDGPKETEPTATKTGIAFVDEMLAKE